VNFFDTLKKNVVSRIIVRRNPPFLSAADDAGEEDYYEPRHQQNLNIDQTSQLLLSK
jgi:hypothetical protein